MFRAILLSLVLFALIFSSCEKESAADDMGIIGSWRLVEVSGGMSSQVFRPDANYEILKFDNSSYWLYHQGSLEKSGSYNIVEDSTVGKEVCLVFTNNSYSRRIDFSGMDDSRKMFYNQNGDTLRFISGCYAYDAGSTKVYVRMKDNGAR